MPLRYILITGLYCFLIFENSSVSDPLPPSVDLPVSDKVAHAVIFGGLCGVVSLGMRRAAHNTLSGWAAFAIPIAFATAYGLTDEIHQLFVPGRSFELTDLLADFIGAAAVQIILLMGGPKANP